MSKKIIIAKVLSKIHKPMEYQEAVEMWESEAERLSKEFDNAGSPPKDIQDFDKWREGYNRVKKEMLELDKILDGFVNTNKRKV